MPTPENKQNFACRDLFHRTSSFLDKLTQPFLPAQLSAATRLLRLFFILHQHSLITDSRHSLVSFYSIPGAHCTCLVRRSLGRSEAPPVPVRLGTRLNGPPLVRVWSPLVCAVVWWSRRWSGVLFTTIASRISTLHTQIATDIIAKSSAGKHQ